MSTAICLVDGERYELPKDTEGVQGYLIPVVSFPPAIVGEAPLGLPPKPVVCDLEIWDGIGRVLVPRRQ